MTVPTLALIPFAGAVVLLAVVRPSWALVLPLVFHAAYRIRSTIPLGELVLPTTLLEVFVGVAVAAASVRAGTRVLVRAQYRAALHSLSRGVIILGLLFLLAATVSAAIAPHPRTSWGQWKAFVVEPFLYALVLLPLLREPSGRLLVARALLWGGAVSAGLSLAAGLAGLVFPPRSENGPWTTDFLRLRGIYDVPNSLALVLAPLSAFAMSLAWFSTPAGTHRLARGALLLMVPALVLTQSLGGLLALVVVALGGVGGVRVVRAVRVVVGILLRQSKNLLQYTKVDSRERLEGRYSEVDSRERPRVHLQGVRGVGGALLRQFKNLLQYTKVDSRENPEGRYSEVDSRERSGVRYSEVDYRERPRVHLRGVGGARVVGRVLLRQFKNLLQYTKVDSRERLEGRYSEVDSRERPRVHLQGVRGVGGALLRQFKNLLQYTKVDSRENPEGRYTEVDSREPSGVRARAVRGVSGISWLSGVRSVAAALLLAVVVLGLGLQFASGRLSHALAEHSPLAARRQFWAVSLQLLRDHPLVGTGLGTFEPAYQAKLHERMARGAGPDPVLEWVVRDPHNLVLSLWLQTGLLGLGAMAALVGTALSRRIAEAGGLAAFAHAARAALVVLLIFGLVDVPYFKNDLSLLWWTLLTLAVTTATGR